MSVKRWNGTSWDNYAGADTSLVKSSTVTTAGDLIVATGAGAVTRLGVGGKLQGLIPDSTQTNGMRWGNDAQIMTIMGANI